MVTEAQIQAVIDQIVEKFHPLKVILFGSYAYGTANEYSDVDLFVLMDFAGHPTHKAVEIITNIDYRFSLDLIVRTPAVLKQRLEWHDFFLMDIVEKGKVMYEQIVD